MQRPGYHDGPFRARYEFYCTTAVDRPSPSMTEQHHSLYAAPKPGQYLRQEGGIESDHPAVAALARTRMEG